MLFTRPGETEPRRLTRGGAALPLASIQWFNIPQVHQVIASRAVRLPFIAAENRKAAE